MIKSNSRNQQPNKFRPQERIKPITRKQQKNLPNNWKLLQCPITQKDKSKEKYKLNSRKIHAFCIETP